MLPGFNDTRMTVKTTFPSGIKLYGVMQIWNLLEIGLQAKAKKKC